MGHAPVRACSRPLARLSPRQPSVPCCVPLLVGIARPKVRCCARGVTRSPGLESPATGAYACVTDHVVRGNLRVQPLAGSPQRRSSQPPLGTRSPKAGWDRRSSDAMVLCHPQWCAHCPSLPPGLCTYQRRGGPQTGRVRA
jgi:hypothetical protein